MKQTPSKIARVFAKMTDFASLYEGVNPYRGQVYYLDGSYYAINPYGLIRLTVALPGGHGDAGRLYVLDDAIYENGRASVKLGENVRTDLDNARDTANRIPELMIPNDAHDVEGPVRFKLATDVALLMKVLEPFRILGAHVQFQRDRSKLYVTALDGNDELNLEASVMNWKGR